MRPVGALIQLDAQSSFCEAYSSKWKPPAPCRSMASSASFWRERTATSLLSDPSGPGVMPASYISPTRTLLERSTRPTPHFGAIKREDRGVGKDGAGRVEFRGRPCH